MWVELWAGEPDESDGLAVTTDGDTLIQLATSIVADDLPLLVETRTACLRPPAPRKVHTCAGGGRVRGRVPGRPLRANHAASPGRAHARTLRP